MVEHNEAEHSQEIQKSKEETQSLLTPCNQREEILQAQVSTVMNKQAELQKFFHSQMEGVEKKITGLERGMVSIVEKSSPLNSCLSSFQPSVIQELREEKKYSLEGEF